MPDIKNINAGKAVVTFVADNTDFMKALNGSQKGLERFATAAANIGSRLNIVGQYMTAPFKEASRIFAQFDDAMRSVQAVTSASSGDFQKLTRQAKDLGATTAFTAQQVAEGMASLGRMGLSSGEISGSIASMMDLSRATGTDLAQASQIAANNMAVFGINASQSAKVADILAVTANSSAQSLEDLGEALKTAGPFAKQAGQTLQQTSAALGVMANMGIRGSMAGTALAKTYKQLANPKVQEYLRGMFGIEATDGRGNLRDVAVILADIGRSVSQLGSAEQISVMEKIFDARGALGGGVLSMNVRGIDQLMDKYRKMDGYASNAAKTADAGLGGAFRNLASATEGVKIALGDATSDALVPFVNKLTDALKALKDIIDSAPGVATAIGGIGAAVSAIGAGLGGLGMLGGLLKSIGSGLSVLAPLAKAGGAAALTPLFTVLGLAGLAAIPGAYLGDMQREKAMFNTPVSNIVGVLDSSWIKGAPNERDVVASQISKLQSQLEYNIARDPAGVLVDENNAILQAIRERSVRLAELAEKQKSVTRSTREFTDWTKKNADAMKFLNGIEDTRNPLAAKLRNLEAERKAYKAALADRINYLTANGKYEDAEKLQAQRDRADSLYDTLAEDARAREKGRDIDAESAKYDAQRKRASIDAATAAELDELRNADRDLYTARLNELILQTEAKIDKIKSVYKDAETNAKSETGSGGATVTKAEQDALDSIWAGFEREQERLSNYQSMMDSISLGGSLAGGRANATFYAAQAEASNGPQVRIENYVKRIMDFTESIKNNTTDNDLEFE